MVEIMHNLWIGNDDDAICAPEHWFVIHACKYPYHARMAGYQARGTTGNSPHHHFIYKDNALALNLVDADDFMYISPIVIKESIKCINNNIQQHPVLLHCNQGVSRSPSIGMLYLATKGLLPEKLDEAFTKFKNTYKMFCPGRGMRMFIVRSWADYYVKL